MENGNCFIQFNLIILKTLYQSNKSDLDVVHFPKNIDKMTSKSRKNRARLFLFEGR